MGNPTGKGGFKPGQSGNPSGRAKLPEELKSIKMLTKEHVSKLINKYGSMPLEALEEMLKNRGTPAFELMICSAMRRAIVEGDISRMDFLLNRTVGKVKDEIESTTKYDKALDEVPKENIISMLKAVNE